MNSNLKMSLKPAVPSTGRQKLPIGKKSLSAGSSVLKKSSDLILSAPHEIWDELFEEVENLKTLLQNRRLAIKKSVRDDLDILLFSSLAHLHVHSGAMIDVDDEMQEE